MADVVRTYGVVDNRRACSKKRGACLFFFFFLGLRPTRVTTIKSSCRVYYCYYSCSPLFFCCCCCCCSGDKRRERYTKITPSFKKEKGEKMNGRYTYLPWTNHLAQSRAARERANRCKHNRKIVLLFAICLPTCQVYAKLLPES